ncbi:MAG: 50S ribosomal protein L22 [Deltaproteobacteria bacterium CG11_big_fil_rev_8_21_14_0_20_47_16]|nr:MAG: 50S ribosomal protein L22 [Deltaproteobacteria bacterium CG11_big_fil_rev_8_21_14_0_20_47_16]
MAKSVSKAKSTFIRITQQKVQPVVNLVRGKRVQDAIDLLQFCERRAALPVLKAIKSAVANADVKGGVDVDNLVVMTARVDQGPMMKRHRPRSRGMAHPVQKKMSHIMIELGEK